MSGFLSDSAMTSSGGGKRPYTIEEDRIICEGLEAGDSASVIKETLSEADFSRTVLSLRYRVGKLREVAEKFDSLEAFHKASK